MFITKKHLSRRTSFAAQVWPSDCRSSTPWFPWTVLRRPPRREASYGLHVSAARRHHGALDAGRRRGELRAVADPPATHAVQETADDRQRTREQASHCAAGSQLNPGTWLSCVTPEASQEPHGGVTIDQMAAARSVRTRRCHHLKSRPKDAVETAHAIAPTAAATARRSRSVTHDTAADGIRSAQAVRTALRPGRHGAGAQGDYEAVREHSRSRHQEARDLQRTLDAPDRAKLGDYLESVREIERRVQKMEAQDLSSLDLPEVPVGANFDQRLNLMFDMIAARLSGQSHASSPT